MALLFSVLAYTLEKVGGGVAAFFILLLSAKTSSLSYAYMNGHVSFGQYKFGLIAIRGVGTFW